MSVNLSPQDEVKVLASNLAGMEIVLVHRPASLQDGLAGHFPVLGLAQNEPALGPRRGEQLLHDRCVFLVGFNPKAGASTKTRY